MALISVNMAYRFAHESHVGAGVDLIKKDVDLQKGVESRVMCPYMVIYSSRKTYTCRREGGYW